MPLLDAQVGDTVQVRNADGETMNAIVTGLQADAGNAPAAPAVSNQATGGTLDAGTYSYRISKVVNGAESLASTAGSTAPAAGTTNQCTITLPGTPGEQYAIYGRTGGSEEFIALSEPGADSYVDTGAITPSGALPTSDDRIALEDPYGGGYLGAPGSGIRPIVKATAVHGAGSVNAYHKR